MRVIAADLFLWEIVETPRALGYVSTSWAKKKRAGLALTLIAGLIHVGYVSWITDKDFDALKERGINTVRLPVSA
jgi:aryl-phospho-beta-D-glucosidase BglC (GH1 family)